MEERDWDGMVARLVLVEDEVSRLRQVLAGVGAVAATAQIPVREDRTAEA